MDVDAVTRKGKAKVARAKIRARAARTRREETARARTPRKRKECDSKETAHSVVNGGIDRRISGRSMASK